MSSQHILTFQKELEVIEYPARVENIERMIASMGGITKISQAFCDTKTKHLELKFHHENPYNKGTSSEIVPGYGVLLAIKVRRYKNKSRKPEYDVRSLGYCKHVFAFRNLCDFQYLPLCRNPTNTATLFPLKHLSPKSPIDGEYFSRSEAPLFCVPTNFARSDTVAPSTSIFRYDPNDNGQQDILATAPKVAFETQDLVAFNMTDPLPMQPDLQILKRMKVKYVSDDQYDRVKKLFEECPIWTRIALLYESGVSNDKLKCIVPALAFYFSTGPWRMLHVRYGYDPRKHFESRHFQTFDFRMRYRTGISEFIAVRKQIVQKQQENTDDTTKLGALIQDVNYPYFDEDKLPRSRQCILRYCDLHVSKVHEMLEKIPSPLAGAVCNDKTGWLPVGFDAQVRQIICNLIKDLLRKHNRKDMDDAPYEDSMEEEDSEEQSEDETFDANETANTNENINIMEDMDID